jgi:hypothetical protein
MSRNGIEDGDFIGSVNGGRECVARINTGPCSEVTVCCAAAQGCRRCSYLTQETRRRTNGDGEGSALSLIARHAAHYASSTPSPLLPRGLGLD